MRTQHAFAARNLRVRSVFVAVATAVGLASWLISAAEARAALEPTTDALALAHAIADHPAFVVGAAFDTTPATAEATAVSTEELAGFWTSPPTSNFAVLSTGKVANVVPESAETSQFSRASDDLGGESFRGGAERDTTILRIDILVPHGASCLRFDYRFFTEESAGGEAGGPFDDTFIAELDTSNWLAVDGTIVAPNTFATTPTGLPVTALNSELFLSSAAAVGTTFDRATPVWEAWTSVRPGEQHSLYLTVFDTTDAERDSAVFVDHLAFGVDQGGESCEQGPTLVTQVFAEAPQTLVGGANAYRVLLEAVGGNPPDPTNDPLASPVEIEAIASISALIPLGFAYAPGSTNGATTAGPANGGDSVLTWAGPFVNEPAPRENVAELRFGVTVSGTPGAYTASATVTADERYFILPTQPSAAIEVVAPAADLVVSYEQQPNPATLDGKIELRFIVTNQGPQPATGATFEAKLPPSLTEAEVSASQGACELGETLTCKLGTIDVSSSVTVTVAGVLQGADLALGASTAATEVDGDLTNNALGQNAAVIAAEEDITPVVGESVSTKANKGIVTVRPPDEKKFVKLQTPTEVPVGTTIDARKGEVKITAAVGEQGDVQAASFARGKFVVQQEKNGLTTLKILGGDFSQCFASASNRADEATRTTQKFVKDGARGRRVIRRLWGRGKGRFRTRGRYAAATVRGTVWRTVDRCDGTLIRVKRGEVIVRDVNRKRAVKIKAGEQFLVKRERVNKQNAG